MRLGTTSARKFGEMATLLSSSARLWALQILSSSYQRSGRWPIRITAARRGFWRRLVLYSRAASMIETAFYFEGDVQSRTHNPCRRKAATTNVRVPEYAPDAQE